MLNFFQINCFFCKKKQQFLNSHAGASREHQPQFGVYLLGNFQMNCGHMLRTSYQYTIYCHSDRQLLFQCTLSCCFKRSSCFPANCQLIIQSDHSTTILKWTKSTYSNTWGAADCRNRNISEVHPVAPLGHKAVRKREQ